MKLIQFYYSFCWHYLITLLWDVVNILFMRIHTLYTMLLKWGWIDIKPQQCHSKYIWINIVLRVGCLSASSSSIWSIFIFRGFWQLQVVFIAVPFLDSINTLDLWICIFVFFFVFHLGVSLVYFPCTKVLLPLVLFIIISLSIEGCLNFVDRTV